MGIISKMKGLYQRQSPMARASLWAFVANIVQRGTSVLATPVFTRLLTTEQYAQYTLYQAWHDIFIIFTSLNLFNHCVMTALTEFEKDRESFIASAQTLITGLTTACFTLYCAAYIFAGNVLGFSLPVMALMFLDLLFFASFNLWAAKERYFFRYKLMTVLSVLIGTMGPVLGVAVVFLFPTKPDYGRIYAVAAVNIVVGLWAFLYNLSRSKVRFNTRYWKYILAYCLPLIPHLLSTRILSRFDRIMISNMVNASKAGIYGLAYNVSMLSIIVNDAILKSLIPWTYQLIRDKSNLSALKRTVNWLLMLVAGLNLLLILLAPEAVRLFAPEEYDEAVYIIPAVSASVFFIFLTDIFANIEYYFAETKFVSCASVCAAGLNVVLNYVCIARFGYIAAGYTTLISYIAYAIGHYIFMGVVTKKHAGGYQYYDNRRILIISLLFLAGSLLVIPTYQYPVIRYMLIAVAVIACIIKRRRIIQYLVLLREKWV